MVHCKCEKKLTTKYTSIYYKIICHNSRRCLKSINEVSKNFILTLNFKGHLLTEISGLESSYRSFLASITASYNLRYCPSLATKHALGELQYAPRKYLQTFKI